jgi:hypothetical protein
VQCSAVQCSVVRSPGIHGVISFQSCYFVAAASRMGGGNKGCNSQKVKRPKVKGFKLEWLDQTIEGSKTSLWLKPDVSVSSRALCTVCPAPCSINTNEGWAAVKQHGKSKKHVKYLEMSQSNPNFQQVDNSSPSIVQSIAKMVEQKEVTEKMTDKRLRSQIIYVASAVYHGCSRLIIECQAEIFPKIFPGSFNCLTTKTWNLKRNKFGYFATHGLYPFFHGKIIQVRY